MKLARRIAMALIAVMSLLLAVSGWIRVRSEVHTFDVDTRRDHEILGRALGSMVAASWARVGEVEAHARLREADRSDLGLGLDGVVVRWVWLEKPYGSLDAPTADRAAQATAVAGGIVSFVARDALGEERRYTLVPVKGSTPSALELSESLAPQKRFVRASVLTSVLTTLALALACALLAGAIGLGLLGRPIKALVEHARRVGRGELDARLSLPRGDEIGELAEEMNAMAEKLAAANAAREAATEQLRQADRLRTVGRLASGLAHELGTPLNVVSVYARMIAGGEDTLDEARQHANTVAEEADRMTAILRQLLDFARHRRPEKARQSLRSVVRQAFDLLGAVAERRNVRLSLEDGDDVEAEVDAGQLHQVITNLVVNAMHAMPSGGTVRARVERRGAEVDVAIGDDGVGIPADQLGRVFDPFFTTKDVGEGTGLGLSVSYGIVQEHGGRFEVESTVGEGSTFHVLLPLEAPAQGL